MLTPQQTAWLVKHGLVCTSDSAGIESIKPLNANVFTRGAYRMVQRTEGGKWQLVHVYLRTSFGFPGPAGHVLSTHASLKEALCTLVSLKGPADLSVKATGKKRRGFSVR